MKLRALAILPVVAVVVACSAADDGTDSSGEAITGSTIVSRADEWVNDKVHYCQAARGDLDGDSACWAWEGPSHRCNRASHAWNAYRSDCSGFVSWAWNLPAVGSGGYVTGDFAPFSGEISHTISGGSLAPGDALNKTDNEHIILFKHWTNPGHTAIFIEEPGCSSSEPYAHEFTSNVTISGDKVFVSYEGAWFYSIRKNGKASGSGSGTGSTPNTADTCSKGGGFCTDTLQCDAGHWIVRQDDPHACTTVVNESISCSKGNGYCTSTLQCENGHWVPRSSDPNACTSGPG